MNAALSRAVESELGGDGAESVDTEGDVFFQGNAEFFGAFVYIVAGDAAGEGFVFQFFLHRGGFDFVNAFAGLDQGASGKEAGQFVAGEECVVKRGYTRDATIVGVA